MDKVCIIEKGKNCTDEKNILITCKKDALKGIKDDDLKIFNQIVQSGKLVLFFRRFIRQHKNSFKDIQCNK